jgi:Tfp pilus assembly protein PilN
MSQNAFGTSAPAAPTSDEPVHRARVEWAGVPRVDLLPPEIREGRRFRRVQRGLAAGVLVTVLATAAATTWAQLQVGAARDDLAQAQADSDRLRGQQAQFADVPKVLAKLDAARAARSAALGRDVRWYRYLDDLAVATPGSVQLSALTMTLGDGPQAAANPLEASGLGTVSFAGETTSFPDVAQWLSAVSTTVWTSPSSAPRPAARVPAAGSPSRPES